MHIEISSDSFINFIKVPQLILKVLKKVRGCPYVVMVKSLDCGIVGSEFEIQSRIYVHFRTNTLENGMDPFILPPIG